jgi:hypothetical protein
MLKSACQAWLKTIPARNCKRNDSKYYGVFATTPGPPSAKRVVNAIEMKYKQSTNRSLSISEEPPRYDKAGRS